MKISLSNKQTQAWDYLEENNEVEEVFYGGAAGGGKSFLGCAWQIYRRLTYPGTNGLIGRNVGKDLRDTTLQTFFSVARTFFNLETDVHFKYYEQKGRILFYNGNFIYLKELKYMPSDQDFHGLGSLEITDAFIDETPEITEKAFEILQSRIRLNLVNGIPKILAVGNPATNWARERWVLDKQNKEVKLKEYQRYIRATLYDNPDSDFVKQYEKNLKKLNPYDRSRLLDGDWTVQINDTPFFYAFDSINHVLPEIEWNRKYTLWISFDFNIDPTTAIVAQKIFLQPLKIIKVFQETGTENLCRVIKNWLGEHNSGLLVTGDNSGHKGSSSAGVLKGGIYNTDFNIIKRILQIGNQQLVDTKTANLRHTHSFKLCNRYLANIPVEISAKDCQLLINDLQIAKRTPEGKLFKSRQEGQAQDVGDAFRYLISGLTKGVPDNLDKEIDAHAFLKEKEE